LRIGHREDLRKIRLVGAGDETLDAIDQVMVTIARRGGPHRCGIGARIGFGLREAASLFPPNDRHEVLFSRRAFEPVQNGTDRRSEYAHATRRQRRGAADLAPHNHLGHHAEPKPAEFLRHVIEPQPERLRLVPQPVGQLLLRLHIVDNFAFERDQFTIDEAPNVLFQKAQLVRKLEIHCACLARELSVLARTSHVINAGV